MFRIVNPKTDFPKLERDLLEKWQKTGLVNKYLQKNSKNKEKYSFLDGPITANNPMGVHHAWGRTYKDFYQRYWNLRGKAQRFQNGFDEQGLWVEVEVEKELGLKSKKDIENLIPGDKFKSLERFINLCKARVKKFSAIQTDQSMRLGYFMDWKNSYHTSSDENNYAIWNFLKTVNDRGWLYKGRDSVPWCPRCGTAISQHEILTGQYKEIIHKTVVFKLKVKNKKNEYLLAWTTTPWTIPGNVALAVDEKLTYWKMTKGDETVYLISPEGTSEIQSKEMLINKMNLIDGYEKVNEFLGKELVGIEYIAPYDDLPKIKKSLGNYIHRVIATDPMILPINPAEGTGIVHIAPGAGGEDFKLGKKEKLPAIEEIDEAGVFLDGFGFISGQFVKKASKLILEDIQKRGFVFKEFDYLHRYPTCWRCKTELVWRVVDEWYIAMDTPSNSKLPSLDKRSGAGKTKNSKDQNRTFREQMKEVNKTISWIPSWGMDREDDWLSNMHDWLISKKRYWGLALPIWECQKCRKFEVIGGKDELKDRAVGGFEKFDGNSPHRPWIDGVKIKCSECGSEASRIPDVGNPWLDAGIVSFSTVPREWFPADFITESFPGQFKNWFYSLIAMSTALKGEKAFKTILGFASVTDEKGEEMHKSSGNAIEFNVAADKIGVDVMRWLYLRHNPEYNLKFGYHSADDVRKLFIIRLWNVYSFFITYANLSGFKPKEGLKSSENVLDKWIISRFNESIKNVSIYTEKYQAHRATEDIENFIINDLSNWYVRRSRERVSLTADNSKDRQDCLNTLYFILVEYSKVLSAFIPFISEEIYTNLTGEESVHLSDWPEFDEDLIDKQLTKDMANVRIAVEIAHAQRKESNRKVRQPLNSLATIPAIAENQSLKILVSEEVNVKDVVVNVDAVKLKVQMNIPSIENTKIDPSLTPELIDEGEARDIIRKIQIERKKIGTRLDEEINVNLPKWPKEYEDEIIKKTLIKSLKNGEFSVVKA